MLGMAMPPPLAEAVARSVIRQMQDAQAELSTVPTGHEAGELERGHRSRRVRTTDGKTRAP
jgi:hypothetical protein